jgi:hypothetical protein
MGEKERGRDGERGKEREGGREEVSNLTVSISLSLLASRRRNPQAGTRRQSSPGRASRPHSFRQKMPTVFTSEHRRKCPPVNADNGSGPCCSRARNPGFGRENSDSGKLRLQKAPSPGLEKLRLGKPRVRLPDSASRSGPSYPIGPSPRAGPRASRSNAVPPLSTPRALLVPPDRDQDRDPTVTNSQGNHGRRPPGPVWSPPHRSASRQLLSGC